MNEHEFCERLLHRERVATAGGHVCCAYAASLQNIEKALEWMNRFMPWHG